jgi:hypothetical protein
MTTKKTKTCSCAPPPERGGFCCSAAELAVLRETCDWAIRTLESEVTAPAVIDSFGVRDVVQHTAEKLKAARRSRTAA